jgi:hypothetical protein
MVPTALGQDAFELYSELSMVIMVIARCVDAFADVQIQNLPRDATLLTQNAQEDDYSLFILGGVREASHSSALPIPTLGAGGNRRNGAGCQRAG